MTYLCTTATSRTGDTTSYGVEVRPGNGRTPDVAAHCSDCQFKTGSFFCDLPAAETARFERIKVTRTYPRGAVLFVEGQPSQAVYMLCKGRVKLSTCSSEGKIVILGIAGPGDILGLSAALVGSEYEVTAEVIERCQLSFLKSADFLSLLQSSPEACLQAARQLSRNYQTAHSQICSLGLSDTVTDKLAKLFLDWSGNGTGGDGCIRLRNSFTHEEIAEMIGVSRETVTRALRYFRENEIVTLKGADLLIHNRRRLKAVIGTRPARP